MRIVSVLLLWLSIQIVLSFTRPTEVRPVGITTGDNMEGVSVDLGPGCEVLLFIDPTCPKCRSLFDRLASLDPPDGTELRWILPPTDSSRATVRALGGRALISATAFDEFEIRAVPAGVLLDDGQVLAAGGIGAGVGMRELFQQCSV